MVFYSCFVDHDSAALIWTRPRMALDDVRKDPANSTTDCRWGIVCLSSRVYHEASSDSQ
jgi:hypothetical protein